MPNTKDRVLVIDDESYIREFVSQVLSEKFQVFFAKNGSESLKLAREVHPSIIILDILMAGQDGIEVCKELRANSQTAEIPVIMLTALNEPEQRIMAFSAGADDYIPKPFRPEELVVRVESKLKSAKRATNARISATSLSCGDIELNVPDLKVTVAGTPIELGTVEFKILSMLLRNCGHLVSREDLIRLVWEDNPPSDRALDPHITALRKKLRNSQGELKTVYGSGYSLVQKAQAS